MMEDNANAQTFINKLNRFAAELEPHERAMLVALVADDDVTGFGGDKRSPDPERIYLDAAKFNIDLQNFSFDPLAFGLDPGFFGIRPTS